VTGDPCRCGCGQVVAGYGRPDRAFVDRTHKNRHRKRQTRARHRPPAPTAADLHALQLHWLHTLPGYRETIRARLDQAARQAEARSRRIDRLHRDVDYLGREVEGCG